MWNFYLYILFSLALSYLNFSIWLILDLQNDCKDSKSSYIPTSGFYYYHLTLVWYIYTTNHYWYIIINLVYTLFRFICFTSILLLFQGPILEH